jgi:hypothetical protein
MKTFKYYLISMSLDSPLDVKRKLLIVNISLVKIPLFQILLNCVSFPSACNVHILHRDDPHKFTKRTPREKKFNVFFSKTTKATNNQTFQPLYFKFSHVRVLLCKTSQVKSQIFKEQYPFQIKLNHQYFPSPSRKDERDYKQVLQLEHPT